MIVEHIACGPAVNVSEHKAIARIKTGLISEPGSGKWFLLTNLPFSVTDKYQSDEIDIVAIGPPGACVIEVKHWSAQYIESHREDVDREAERINGKARKVAAFLRKHERKLGHVDSAFLVTRSTRRPKGIKPRISARGVHFSDLQNWKDAIKFHRKDVLNGEQVRNLSHALERTRTRLADGSLKQLGEYIRMCPLVTDNRFHQIYSATHATRQDEVILHIYDLSAIEDSNGEAIARREWETLQRLQQYSWAPRIIDSFQEFSSYQGELFHFSIESPSAPSIEDRAKDEDWLVEERVIFARDTVGALIALHEQGRKNPDDQMVHRNLSPRTILVGGDNKPILTGFERARIPANVTVSPAIQINKDDATVAPEVRTDGLGAADPRSDTYSLCASLLTLFANDASTHAIKCVEVLDSGRTDHPESRCALGDIKAKIDKLVGQPPLKTTVPSAQSWSRGLVVPFNGRQYKIVSPIGSGGTGITFRVVELDKNEEEMGNFVIKAVPDGDRRKQVRQAHSVARPHTTHHSGLSVIFEVADDSNQSEIVALLALVEGTPLDEWKGRLHQLVDKHSKDSSSALVLHWVKTTCMALDALHTRGLIHGDVSPRNFVLLHDGNLVLTDFDCVAHIGHERSSIGTPLYRPPSANEKQLVSPSDDFYSLAASMFHVLFNREPFRYNGNLSKYRGLNWEGLSRDNFPTLADFLGRATDPVPQNRFETAKDVLAILETFHIPSLGEAQQDALGGIQIGQELPGIVTEITDSGALVDLGGGLVGVAHKPNLSWALIKNITDSIRVGDQIRVKVLDIDRAGHISLGRKQLRMY